MLEAIKRFYVGVWLKRFFSKDNLIQPSTWRGIVYGIIGFIGINLSPEVQDKVVQAIVATFSAGFMINGAINAARDENKPKSLPWKAETETIEKGN